MPLSDDDKQWIAEKLKDIETRLLPALPSTAMESGPIARVHAKAEQTKPAYDLLDDSKRD